MAGVEHGLRELPRVNSMGLYTDLSQSSFGRVGRKDR